MELPSDATGLLADLIAPCPGRSCSWAVLLLGGCGSNKNNNEDDILQNAASCESIPFKSRPTVLLADHGDPAPNGDTSLELVADVPNVEAFKKLSGLPEPTPGPQQEWLESALKDFESKDKNKALADVLKAGSPAGFQHVLQGPADTHYSRLVVIQKTPPPDTRIDINARCG